MDQEENTKEILNLEELKEKELDTLELDIIEELDENQIESDEKFEELLEEQENNVEEPVIEDETVEEKEKEEPKTEEKKKKKSFKEKLASLKEKWKSLPKKKKITILIISLIILIAIITGIVFLILHFNKEKTTSKVPDIILEEDNYRYQNGSLILLDKKGNEIGSYECEHQNQETCYVAYYSDEDHFDEPKFQYEDGTPLKTRSKIILEQYAWIYDNEEKEEGNILLYDFKAGKKIEEYLLVKGYDSLENKYIVKQISGEYSLINITEESIQLALDSTYDYLGFINSKENNQIYVSKRADKWYLIDQNDQTLTKAISYEIKDYQNEKIKATDNLGKYHLLDYNGAELKDTTFEYIDLLENYILYIQDGTIKVEDYEGNKMSEEIISIKNPTYLPVGIYSKDNKLIKNEKSYEVSYQGNLLVIEVFDESGINSEKTSMNVNEGKLSSHLANLNYFNGKLYIYGDKEKKNLLGTYSCENKNNISEGITTLSNCAIAKESFYQDNDIEKSQAENLGVLPIYNERYIFINDSKNIESNPNIVLYDLKENAVKSKYKSIDAGAYTKTNEVNFVSANNTHIIAENLNGKVGIIRMNSNNVEGVKGFDFDHIERIGLYYIVHNESGYQLMDHTGNMISAAIPNKIRNFDIDSGYLTVRDNSAKYYLYEMSSGKKITNSGADYISLYQNYFGSVNNKTLKFYAYENPTVSLGNTVNLKQTNYYGDGTLAYTASINGTEAIVRVGNGNNYDPQITIDLAKGEDNANTEE